jgi:hypothetical protein
MIVSAPGPLKMRSRRELGQLHWNADRRVAEEPWLGALSLALVAGRRRQARAASVRLMRSAIRVTRAPDKR